MCALCRWFTLGAHATSTVRRYSLSGVHKPFFRNWLLSDPSIFLTPEVLHHFHCLCWDNNLQWCIVVLGPDEIDYRFSLIQAAIRYHSFKEGVSKLKQVMGFNHCAMQRYIIGVIAGAVPPKFLAVSRTKQVWYSEHGRKRLYQTILMRRMRTMEPHRSHLLHKKTILMQETTADADSHLLHKNRQEAEETEGITSSMV